MESLQWRRRPKLQISVPCRGRACPEFMCFFFFPWHPNLKEVAIVSSRLYTSHMWWLIWRLLRGNFFWHVISSAFWIYFSLRSCRSSSVNFLWFFARKFGKFSGKFGGNFAGFFWPTEQRLKHFGENSGAFFVTKFVARKKNFRAKFTLQTCHLKIYWQWGRHRICCVSVELRGWLWENHAVWSLWHRTGCFVKVSICRTQDSC